MESQKDIESRYLREAQYVEEIAELAQKASEQEENGSKALISQLLGKAKELHRTSKLLQNAQQERLQNDLFIRIGVNLSRKLALDELLPQIIDSLREIVQYDAAGIFLVDISNGQIEGQVLRGYKIDALNQVKQKVGQGIMGVVIQTGQAVRVGDVSQDPQYINARDTTQSEMAVPLLSEGTVIGCFNLESDHKDAYSEHDQELLTTFASHAAIAIERVQFYREVLRKRQYEEELALARQIQLSFLPRKVPVFPPYDLAGINFPSQAVGGDYYDFVPLTDQDLGIVIGDVSGKGIGAALIMASFRASLRAECYHQFAIRDILAAVNHFLWESTAADQFVTAFYGVLNREKGLLTYGNAGHDPPVLIRANDEVEKLPATGIVLGAFADAVYEEKTITLKSGDALLLYTDGVTEAKNSQDEEFRVDGLIAQYFQNRNLPSGPLVRQITRAVQRYSAPEAVGDDLTVISVRVPAQ